MTIKDLVATRAIFSANCFLSPCAGHAKQRNKMAILHIYTRFYGRKTHPSFFFSLSTICYCKNNIFGCVCGVEIAEAAAFFSSPGLVIIYSDP